MVKKIIKSTFHLILLVLLMQFVSASNMTVDQLIDSYNYDYSDGSINITGFNDYMIDVNSNGVNDTLVINLTTNASTSTTYFFVVSLYENNNLIVNYFNATVSSLNPWVNLSFELLNFNKYNYSTEIRYQDYSLAFMKYKTQTNSYSSYETRTNISQIADYNINNNTLRINMTLNVKKNETVNITVVLNYGGLVISGTKQATLTSPSQVVSVDIDNETIKSTHYAGAFNITQVNIGEQVLNTNQMTQSYNYESFAKSSYIKSITSRTYDNNSNNLTDAIQFNFTIIAKTMGVHSIEATLYDENNKFIASLLKNQSLSIGNQSITIDIPGKTFYSTYSNNQYIISYVKLSISNITTDIIYNAYTTNMTYYTDFERPPLSDLTLFLNVTFSNNQSNITLNLSNIGDAPAFNIFTYIFDNASYENSSSIDYLAPNQSVVLSFLIINSSNGSIVTAIADFYNSIDEENESNNIAQAIPVQGEPPVSDSSLFDIKNSQGVTVAWFGDLGNIILKGSLIQNANYSNITSSAFIISNDDRNNLVITENGDMYISGLLYNNQQSLFSSNQSNDFRIANNNNLVSFVNETGSVFIKGRIIENSDQ